MLGKGLESLIPAGGYKKQDDSSTSSGQASLINPEQASLITGQAFSTGLPQAGLGQNTSINSGQDLSTSSGQVFSTENKPQHPTAHFNQELHYPVASQSVYPGGHQPYFENASAASQISQELAQRHQQYSPEKNIPASSAPTYEHPSLIIPPALNYCSPAIQESEIKPAVVPLFAASNREGTDSLIGLKTGSTPSVSQQNYDREEDYSKGQASVFQIEVERIFPNPHQPRRYFDEGSLSELANSIREFGIIQPLIVTKMLKEMESGTEVTYQLIAGERRLMAAKKVGLRTVPVIIKRIGMDRERLELAIIENIQREDLNPLEAARSYARLQDEFGLTQREIAIRIGKSRETIANALRLLNLPSEIQQALQDGRINESHARLLLQINDITRQKDMLQSIVRAKPSVRELKATIKRERISPAGRHVNPELISLQLKLEEFLGTKAKIDDNGGEGRITINYYSPEELTALISRLSGENF